MDSIRHNKLPPLLLQLIIGMLIVNLTNGGELRKAFIHPPDTINKVSLTQRGYIQFLKYIVDVPTLSEFTFCIWMRSDNLTLPHPLFSYSMNQEEKIVRMWLDDQGSTANMVIFEEYVFKIPVIVKENHWNHFCPSWNSKSSTWSFYMNGKLIQSGINYKLRNVVIPPKGDLVVGQEYTDFNKGLDDGIEGDIFGFNLVASSTNSAKITPYRRQLYIPYADYVAFNANKQHLAVAASQEVPQVLGYFKTSVNRSPKGLMDFGTDMLRQFYKLFETRQKPVRIPVEYYVKTPPLPPPSLPKYYSTIKRAYAAPVAAFNSVVDVDKTLGTFLVELSYGNCALGKGAPLVDEKVIVSWTKTPVRVFGGAILKTVSPFCKKY